MSILYKNNITLYIRSGKKQTDNNFYENDDTFETGFATRHVSVTQ